MDWTSLNRIALKLLKRAYQFRFVLSPLILGNDGMATASLAGHPSLR